MGRADEVSRLVLGLGLLQAAVLGGLAVLAVLCVGRPLRDLAQSADALGRGELHRPVTVSATATAEIRELVLVWEEMRRSLITKLRSSTEMNLQLESEVARRSTELSRRNAELSEALERLAATRDELLRTEKLAAVGRIAATVTGAIRQPMGTLSAAVETLQGPLIAVLDELEQAPPTRQTLDLTASQQSRLAEVDDMLELVLRSAIRVRDIVAAMRVYARPQNPASATSPSDISRS